MMTQITALMNCDGGSGDMTQDENFVSIDYENRYKLLIKYLHKYRNRAQKQLHDLDAHRTDEDFNYWNGQFNALNNALRFNSGEIK